MKTWLLTLACLTMTAPAFAQESPNLRVPIMVFVATSQLDAATTLWGQRSYGLREVDPLYAHVSSLSAVVLGAGIDAAQVVLWKRLGRHHPRLATFGLIVSAGLRAEASVQTLHYIQLAHRLK